MTIETQLDELIRAGRNVLATDFNEASFREWQRQALVCISAICGPDHTYTEYFRNRVRKAEEQNVLTGVGLLTAARLQPRESSPAAQAEGNGSIRITDP
jgi:hypothetical protein